MKLAISKIKIDETIYPRSNVSEFNVSRLVYAIRAGTRLPPVTVEAKTIRLVDGRHRYEALIREGIKSIEVTEKVYASEADLFADAVRLNISHGEPLDSYNVRSAIIRLSAYGYTKESIADVVRLPIEQIDKIERGFASDAGGKPVALKGGLSHLAGTTLTPAQQEINRRYAGGKAIFYVRQLKSLIEGNILPPSAADEMDSLVELWLAQGKPEPKKAAGAER